MKATDIFTPDNTEWCDYLDDDGHQEHSLEYNGDIAELALETGLSIDRLYDLLSEYERLSLDLIESERERDEARLGQY